MKVKINHTLFITLSLITLLIAGNYWGIAQFVLPYKARLYILVLSGAIPLLLPLYYKKRSIIIPWMLCFFFVLFRNQEFLSGGYYNSIRLIVPTKQEMQLYEGILCTERKAVGDRGFGKINHRRLYPAAVRHYDSLFPNNHIELFDFQNEGNMEQLNEEFCALIHDANTNERNVLRFINHRPAYHIIAGVFKYYNFGHHDAYVFPEFALGKYIADYLLIGKSSGGYEFVFVELEHPNGRTTLKSGHEGETFRKGTYQIYDWKAEIEAHFSASFVTITKYSNKSSLPKEFSEYDSSRFHYAVVAGLREDYNEATYRDRRNKVTQQNILTLHYDNLYDKACELETAQSF